LNKKISIFIPAFNAEEHIVKVINRIPQSIRPELNAVYIINDGSSDNTASVIDQLGKNDLSIKPVHFKNNKGYGWAVRTGLKMCLDDGCDYAVCVHADGQYPPESIPGFIDKMQNEGIDILQGSRIASGTALSGGMPLYKFIAGKCLTALENLVFGLRMTDYHSGFLLYSRRAIESIPLEKLSGSFDFDLEVIASARAKGLSIAESAIPTRYAGEKSYLNPITYGLRVLRVVCKYSLGGYIS